MSDLTVEQALKQLREMGFGGHNTVTIHDCPSQGCRSLAVAIETMGGSSWKAPTLTKCLAKARAWRKSNDHNS